MLQYVKKRDGRKVLFNIKKISDAIFAAARSVGGHDYQTAEDLSWLVAEFLEKNGYTFPEVEQIQDAVEKILVENGHYKVSKSYILYRSKREKIRDQRSFLMEKMMTLISKNTNEKRENANIDANTSMGLMLKFGSESAKHFYLLNSASEFSELHKNGEIHIHDLDFYGYTTTCCQIDLKSLLERGFSTGHGYVRPPNDILTSAALCCIAIQANQNDQHGGQSIPNFDYALAPFVAITFKKHYLSNLAKAFSLLCSSQSLKATFDTINTNEILYSPNALAELILNRIEKKHKLTPNLSRNPLYDAAELNELASFESAKKIQDFCQQTAENETKRATYQAMEALVHNLNTMHSRAGAQVPFSSLNYGTDISPEGRLVTKSLLLATEAGLGSGETPIFPIQIFKVKDGISGEPGDSNYDLFKLACRVSSKRLFPNFSFLDAPFNAKYYKPGHPGTEVAYMGCRTRVLSNAFDRTRETTFGRGNLSFTSINLVKIAITSKREFSKFFAELDRLVKICVSQLKNRFEIQKERLVENFPFLMGQGIWLDSDKLPGDAKLGDILKHGSLSVGFIGLAECLKYMLGVHHGESIVAQTSGLKIIKRMRKILDEASEKHKMNFTLLATPAEGLSGRFVQIDKKRFGIIKGVTDREYYTNSFHVPVYYEISPFEKIKIEAPYHELTNAGHITYIEVDGDISKNQEAFVDIINCMKKSGIGYGGINHPVDHDPFCGYTGIIDEICPKCTRNVENETNPQFKIERIRRITGYVGKLTRFNDAKLSEVADRVKHTNVNSNEILQNEFEYAPDGT